MNTRETFGRCIAIGVVIGVLAGSLGLAAAQGGVLDAAAATDAASRAEAKHLSRPPLSQPAAGRASRAQETSHTDLTPIQIPGPTAPAAQQAGDAEYVSPADAVTILPDPLPEPAGEVLPDPLTDQASAGDPIPLPDQASAVDPIPLPDEVSELVQAAEPTGQSSTNELTPIQIP